MNEDTKDMLKTLSAIALPIMLQSLVQSSLGFLDTLMIGQLGQSEIAAVGTANQVNFLVQIFYFGITSGVSIFLAQFYGAKQFEKMRKVMALALSLTFLGGIASGLLAILAPGWVMHFFSQDATVISNGITYLKTVGASYLVFGISMQLSAGFRSQGDSKTPLYITILSLSTNAVLNYLLIFGIGPFPALGVMGGAIATTISRVLELSILLFLCIKRKAPFLVKKTSDFLWDKEFLLIFFITAIPALVNDCLWSFGSTLYKVAFSKLGTEALAVTNLSESIGNFFFIAAMGMANGSAVVLGNVLGAGEQEKAKRWGSKMTVTSLLLGLFMGSLEAASAPLFANLFNISPSAVSLTIKTLSALAVIQPIETLATVLIVGILRSGGDTTFGLITETGCLYLIGLPFVYLGVYAFKLPLYGLYLLKLTEMVSKVLFAYWRMKSGKWANVMTETPVS